jgi:RNA methyltransferase, TrmH family
LIRSRSNPQVKRWARLMRDGRLRRTEGRALIEGPHLLAAALAAGLTPVAVLATEAALTEPEIARLSPIVLSDSVLRSIMDVETPQGIAAEIAIPRPQEREGDRVYLEGVQDAGNVGAIIRSAAAFGIKTLCFDRDCADPWSPKVLRAGMGGHFALSIQRGDAREFSGKLVCTVVKEGTALSSADLSGRIAWVFGSEGKGVSPEVQRRAAVRVTIPIEPGTESLNVAAAAAICLYEAYRRQE